MIKNWQEDRSSITAAVFEYGQNPPPVLANATVTTMMTSCNFGPFEGRLGNGPYLRIGLSVGQPARLFQKTDNGIIEGFWQRGSVCITLPHAAGEIASSSMQMVGLAVDLSRTSDEAGVHYAVDDFRDASGVLQKDPLVASVLTSLWLDGEAHGMSSAFFDHGVSLILKRLRRQASSKGSISTIKPLRGKRLQRVVDLVESRLESDVRVSELAREAGQDETSFRRAFFLAMGQAPYAYLTMRRMERAKEILVGGASVTETALTLGYANPSKFAAAFRRVFACSPSEWKTNN